MGGALPHTRAVRVPRLCLVTPNLSRHFVPPSALPASFLFGLRPHRRKVLSDLSEITSKLVISSLPHSKKPPLSSLRSSFVSFFSPIGSHFVRPSSVVIRKASLFSFLLRRTCRYSSSFRRKTLTVFLLHSSSCLIRHFVPHSALLVVTSFLLVGSPEGRRKKAASLFSLSPFLAD